MMLNFRTECRLHWMTRERLTFAMSRMLQYLPQQPSVDRDVNHLPHVFLLLGTSEDAGARLMIWGCYLVKCNVRPSCCGRHTLLSTLAEVQPN